MHDKMNDSSYMLAVTIDMAIERLQEAKAAIGGDKCLILSLSRSELPDATVNAMHIVNEGESQYVEVRVFHESLGKPPPTPSDDRDGFLELRRRNLDNLWR